MSSKAQYTSVGDGNSDSEDDLIVTGQQDHQTADKGKSRAQAEGPLSSNEGGGESSNAAQVSGSIGRKPQQQAQGQRQVIGGIGLETRTGGMSTLDEPLTATLMRDVRGIANKCVQVLRPTRQKSVLREWDLWGPLIFCLSLAVILSWHAPPEQSLSVFTGVFVIVWIGGVVVTLNAKLLGGKVSFFQSLCVLGYCIFPVTLAALINLFVQLFFVRLPVSLIGFAWAAWAATNFLEGTRLEEGRAVLAVYPTYLLFFVLSWIVLLS